jgi:hypothetical protein
VDVRRELSVFVEGLRPSCGLAPLVAQIKRAGRSRPSMCRYAFRTTQVMRVVCLVGGREVPLDARQE